MSQNQRLKIIFSMAIALLFTLVLTNLFFFTGIPKVNKEKVKRSIKNFKDDLTIFKNTFTYKISSKKVNYDQVFEEAPPTVEFTIPTTNPLPTPTVVHITIMPTTKPTLTPTPTEIILAKISPTRHISKPAITKKIIKKPTKVPTKKPKPSPTPKDDPLKISNPLDQPYYNPSKANLCYNTDKLIEVYASGVSKASCYSKVRDSVSSNLTSVSILGKSISINKRAYPAFKAVADELNKNSVAKKYKINTIGAYIFRCNVNASGSSDLCSSDCVLSTHSFGISVDINYEENCNGCSSYTMPMEIVDIFESYGFRWGGRYKSVFGSTIDPMHFEYMYDLCKNT